jgi:hypothetical protein
VNKSRDSPACCDDNIILLACERRVTSELASHSIFHVCDASRLPPMTKKGLQIESQISRYPQDPFAHQILGAENEQ